MPSPDQWLKLHTSLLLSSKFTSLPNNDCRWAFICLMMLCKKGVISPNMTWNRSQTRSLLGHLALTSRRWKVVKHVLFESGLITSDFWVIGFEDSQIRPSALRKRRQRERDSHKKVTVNVTTEERREKKEKIRVTYPDEAYETTDLLITKMVANNPNAKVPDKSNGKYSGWVKTTNDINRLDKYKWDDIKNAVAWSQDDGFWRRNILSPSKLRKQMGQLVMIKGEEIHNESRDRIL